MYHTCNMSFPPQTQTHTQTLTHTHTHTHTHKHTHTHTHTQIWRCYIVLTQPTYTTDFYHQPDHSYIAGRYTPLKANQTVTVTKTIHSVDKAHLPSRRHPSRGHPSQGHPSQGHPSQVIRLGSSVSGASLKVKSSKQMLIILRRAILLTTKV